MHGRTLTLDNKFIIKSFLDATRVVEFHEKWMTTETWAALVFHHFEFPSSLRYDGKQLHKAITLDRRLAGSMDSECGASTEQSNVFRRWYKPKGVKGNIYCYYTTQLGGKPLNSTTKWFNTINHSNELLIIKNTIH